MDGIVIGISAQIVLHCLIPAAGQPETSQLPWHGTLEENLEREGCVGSGRNELKWSRSDLDTKGKDTQS